jgi:hypothetical protein
MREGTKEEGRRKKAEGRGKKERMSEDSLIPQLAVVSRYNNK